MPRILVVEDDDDIASVVCRGLRAEGFEPVAEVEPSAALTRLTGERFDAAVVDRMLGGDSSSDAGGDLVRAVRGRGLVVPVFLLRALARVSERAEGLAAGADDYVVKPFEMAELVARLRVQLMRRKSDVAGAPAPLRCGGLTWLPERRLAVCATRSVELTEREGALLQQLLSHAGQIVPRRALLEGLWSGQGVTTDNVVDVYIGYLRRKLAPIEDFGVSLHTLRGRGCGLEPVT
jgi:DNA-binding response OmpR family regulator